MARAAPEGYTLLMTGGSTMSLLPLTASTPLPYALGQEAVASGPEAVFARSAAEQKAYAPLITSANIKTD